MFWMPVEFNCIEIRVIPLLIYSALNPLIVTSLKKEINQTSF